MGFLVTVTSARALLAISAVIALLVFKSFSRVLSRKSNYNLPPGPKPFPLIGNLLDLPKDHDWLHWAKHKDVYGPISSVTVFGQPLIILNDVQAAIDLFVNRSNIYSDRPKLVFSGKLCGWGETLVFLPFGETFKRHRRYIHQSLGTYKSIERYHDLMTIQTHTFLWSIHNNPNKLTDHIRFLAGAVTLRMLYGYEATRETNDPLVELAKRTIKEFSDATLPGRWIVDTLPFLRHVPSWLPGAAFKRVAKQYKRSFYEFVDRPLEFVKQEMAEGSALESYAADLLDSNSLDSKKYAIIQNSAASLYLGGTDTTVSTLHTFFLAMMLYPDVQKKAHAELDLVVGTHRFPTIDDRRNLPFINAVVKEALRWNPVLPMGFPHVPSQDDIYRGHLFPKGAIILPNIWLFTHDPKNYKDPAEFRPERFLSTGTSIPEQDPYDLIFGFGRRECPGKLFADVQLFLAIAMSLSVFNIMRPTDDSGRPIEEKYEFSSIGITNHPKDFACIIRPRCASAVELISNNGYPIHSESGHAKKLLDLNWGMGEDSI